MGKVVKKVTKPFNKVVGKVTGAAAMEKEAKAAAKQAEREQAEYDKNLAADYWQNYSQWQGQAASSLETDLSSARAKFSASGGMEAYEQYEQDRRAKYDEELAGIESGETARFLRDYATKQGAQDMTEYYTQTFGEGYTPPEQGEVARSYSPTESRSQRGVGMLKDAVKKSGMFKSAGFWG